MLKIQSAQNWFTAKRMEIARPPDSGAANGSENGRRMREIWPKEYFAQNIRKFEFFKKIKKRIFRRIFLGIF